MAAVMTAPMGPPMGGSPMGPPMGGPAPMPNMGGMAPPMGQPPMQGGPQPQQPQLSTAVGYGGSAKGRAGFKASLRNRKQQFQQNQQMMAPPPQPQAMPPMGGPPQMQAPQMQGGVPPQMGRAPMGAMRPPQPMGPQAGIAGPGRMVGDNSSVGSAPVQMMDGGVVPLFGGLGRY